MDSNPKCSRFHNPFGSIARTILFRLLLLASAISIVSILHSLPTTFDIPPKSNDHHCIFDFNDSNLTLPPGSYLFQSRILNSFWGSFDSFNCHKEFNFVSNVVNELKGHQQLFNSQAQSLCIGQNSNIVVSILQKLGFNNVHNHNQKFVNKKNFLYSLDEYRDSSFDFVFSKGLDRITVPALLVLEVERILKPNGIGVFVLDFDFDFDSDLDTKFNINKNINMIRSASPISSLLRFSSIVHVGLINNQGLVVFKKNSESESEKRRFLFNHENLPKDCKRVNFNKKFMNLMEPLVKEKSSHQKKSTYLAKFVEVKKKNLVYINIGEGDWFPQSYPIDMKDFNVYYVHYNTSIMLSHMKGPGVMFIYHPELNENFKKNAVYADTDEEEEEEFDLVSWFKETVENADFVVVKMNAGKVEMKFLLDIYENGVICFVDELFLRCEESGDGERCMDIYKGLRSNGVFVHQWWN